MTDPEAIRQERIAELEQEITEIETKNKTAPDWGSATGISWLIISKRSELSRLRNEQSKGGDAIDRKAKAAAARHEVNKGKPWPTERLINDLVAAGESEYAPSPSPEPQDAREALNRAIRSVEALYLCGYTGNILLDNLYIVQAALAQSDAQPVGWLFSLAKYRDSVTGEEYVDWGPDQFSFTKPHVPEGSIRNLRPLYTAPSRPDASGLIEAAEIVQEYRAEIGVVGINGRRQLKTYDPDIREEIVAEERGCKIACDRILEAIRSRAADRSAPRSYKGGA